jgi:hypothetical protein
MCFSNTISVASFWGKTKTIPIPHWRAGQFCQFIALFKAHHRKKLLDR